MAEQINFKQNPSRCCRHQLCWTWFWRMMRVTVRMNTKWYCIFSLALSFSRILSALLSLSYSLSWSVSFIDGYCSTVQGLLDWFEVDFGFTELLFIQIDVCVMCFFVLYLTFPVSSLVMIGLLLSLSHTLSLSLFLSLSLSLCFSLSLSRALTLSFSLSLSLSLSLSGHGVGRSCLWQQEKERERGYGREK